MLQIVPSSHPSSSSHPASSRHSKSAFSASSGASSGSSGASSGSSSGGPSAPSSPASPFTSRALSANFCNRDEFLLFIDQFETRFCHEAELRPMDMDEALDECEDTTLQVIRLDHSNWRGEDVTEEVASAWLYLHAPEPEMEHTLPDFVVKSEAWLDYLDACDAEDDAENGSDGFTRLDAFDLGVGRYAS